MGGDADEEGVLKRCIVFLFPWKKYHWMRGLSLPPSCCSCYSFHGLLDLQENWILTWLSMTWGLKVRLLWFENLSQLKALLDLRIWRSRFVVLPGMAWHDPSVISWIYKWRSWEEREIKSLDASPSSLPWTLSDKLLGVLYPLWVKSLLLSTAYCIVLYSFCFERKEEEKKRRENPGLNYSHSFPDVLVLFS